MDGILVINKPAGMTSHDVISVLRKKYKQKKFGHTGTLDPQASGVLVVLAGKAAKILQFLEDTDKEYIAKIQLGIKTDTDDIWGEVLEEKPVNLDFDFQEVLNTFAGKQSQKVPSRSAKKVNGKKLMDYQLKNQEVPEVYSDIEIYGIEALDPESLEFKVSCSSGTYVRSICRDFGQKTGNDAVMSSLIRTRASGYTLEQAEELDQKTHTLHPLIDLLPYRKVHYEPAADVYNGKSLHLPYKEDRIVMMDGDEPIAIYDRHHKDVFCCSRGIWS